MAAKKAPIRISLAIVTASARHCGFGCVFYECTLNAGSGGCVAFEGRQPGTDDVGYMRLPECIAAEVK